MYIPDSFFNLDSLQKESKSSKEDDGEGLLFNDLSKKKAIATACTSSPTDLKPWETGHTPGPAPERFDCGAGLFHQPTQTYTENDADADEIDAELLSQKILGKNSPEDDMLQQLFALQDRDFHGFTQYNGDSFAAKQFDMLPCKNLKEAAYSNGLIDRVPTGAKMGTSLSRANESSNRYKAEYNNNNIQPNKHDSDDSDEDPILAEIRGTLKKAGYAPKQSPSAVPKSKGSSDILPVRPISCSPAISAHQNPSQIECPLPEVASRPGFGNGFQQMFSSLPIPDHLKSKAQGLALKASEMMNGSQEMLSSTINGVCTKIQQFQQKDPEVPAELPHRHSAPPERSEWLEKPAKLQNFDEIKTVKFEDLLSPAEQRQLKALSSTKRSLFARLYNGLNSMYFLSLLSGVILLFAYWKLKYVE